MFDKKIVLESAADVSMYWDEKNDEFDSDDWLENVSNNAGIIPTDDLMTNLISQIARQLDPNTPIADASWKPQEGPQTDAFYSKADELFFGGSAGGGKSDLLIGIATSEHSPHRKSVIFREAFTDLQEIAGRVLDIYGPKGAKFKQGSAMRFEGLPDGKVLELGNIPNFARAKRKWQGRPHDLKLFDEVPNIDPRAYTFLSGWTRTPIVGLKPRIVSAGNPPTTEDGLWVVQRFAPWLDPNHKNPAKPNELRWYSMLDGEDTELTDMDGGDGTPFEFTDRSGVTEIIYPKSRTFIPSRLSDNAYYNRDPNYRATLQALPEPLRSMLLNGDFGMAVKPDQWQVVQRMWVNMAIDRWKEAQKNIGIDVLDRSTEDVTYGYDVAAGGEDMSCLAKRVGDIIVWLWFFKEPDMMKQAEMVNEKIFPSNAPIAVDENGLGMGVAHRLKQMGRNVLGFKGSMTSKYRTEDGQLGFENLRCEMWWRLRDQLNPEGRAIKLLNKGLALPDDSRLIGELTAPRYAVRGSTRDSVVWIDDVATVKKKIGRSPDGAIAVMLAVKAQAGLGKPRMV